jgi:predicted PurR-regulated permease PerM
MDSQARNYAYGIALGGTAILAAWFLMHLVIQLREILAVLSLGIVVGIALSPLVEYFARFKVPRVFSVLMVYAVFGVALGVFFWYATVEVLREALEVQVEELRERYEETRNGIPLPPWDEAEEFVRERGAGLAGEVIDQAFSAITGFFYLFTILVSGLLFTITKERMRQVFLSLIEIPDRERAAQILDILGRRIRRFVVGELVAMTVVGALTYIGLTILGINFALLLAVLAFIFEVLPMVGPWIAYFPALAVALTQGIVPAIQVSILYLLIQQIESYVVVPLVQGREAQLPALLIIVSLLIGGVLMGILGALIALPTAVVIHTLFFELFVPWRQSRLRSRPVLVTPEEDVTATGP